MSILADKIERLLNEAFPLLTIHKEYFVSYNNQKLFVDFYIPSYNIAVEVHGVQHDRFVSHFHSDEKGWREHKQRDRIKEEWAAVNNITYLVIREKDCPNNKEELLDRIREINDG